MGLCSQCLHQPMSLDEYPCNRCNRFDPGIRDRWAPQTIETSDRPSMFEPAEGCMSRKSPGVPAQIESDPVNPNHYKLPGGLEVIQITRHLNRNRGAAVEYILRAGQKKLVEGQEVEDLKKARWAIDDEIQRLTGVGDHAR